MIDLLGQSATPFTLTGNTLLTEMGRCLIPAAVMGLNGSLRVQLSYQHNNSAGNKTISLLFAGQTAFSDVETTQSLTMSQTVRIRNRAAANSQHVSGFSGNCSSEFTPTPGAAVVDTTLTVDTTRDQVLQFMGQLANGADTLILNAWTVEIMRVGP